MDELTERLVKQTLQSSAIVYSLSLKGNFTHVNHLFEQITGYTSVELAGTPFTSILTTPQLSSANEPVPRLLQSYEVQIYSKNGSVVDLSVVSVPIWNNKEMFGFYCVAENLAERKKQEAKWLENEQMYRGIIKHASDVFIILDKTNKILYVSPTVEQILGYNPEHMIGRSGVEFIPGIKNIITEEGTHTSEINIIRADGGMIDAEVGQTNMLNYPGIGGVVVTIRDITEKKKIEKKIYHAAFHDHVTGLPNRRMFEEQLDIQLRLGKFSNKKLAILLIDLDRFKLINDTLGHPLGDILLKQFAAKLQQLLGKGQKAYRLGGDEFCIVLSEVTDHDEVISFSNTVIQMTKEEFSIEGYELNITVSIGISLSPKDGNTVESLLKNADTALYFAKSQGRDQSQCYSSSLNVEAFKLFTLNNDLRKALEKKQLFLQYMPRVNTETTQIIGVEALIRWNHPDWGLISPTEFIPIAEETGLIVPIGEWVLREACRQNKQWKDMGLPSVIVSVNFTVQQLLKKNILQTIENILEETGLSPERLEIEITESSFITNEKEVTHLLAELRKRKIKVSLDDFGTGYSSLYLLKKLKMDALKIDKSFVQELLTDSVNKSIIKSIMSLAKAMQMDVVAEGVETEEQYLFLKGLKCDQIQGYYFSRPLAAEEFANLFKDKDSDHLIAKVKQEDPYANRREYFRLDLVYPLIVEMTISMFKGRQVEIGSLEVYVNNIGPSGLRFLMGVKLPINNDIIIQFKINILNKVYIAQGNIAWFNTIADGEVYEYGIEFLIEDSMKLELLKTFNLLAIKLREGHPPHTKLFIGDPIEAIKERKKQH